MGSEMCIRDRNIYFESRNQPKIGKIAVAQVTLNRVKSDKFPSTVCEVIYQGGERRNRCQFSWYCDGKKDKVHPMDKNLYKKIKEFSHMILIPGVNLLDITDGATHYHADYIDSPRWSKFLEKTVKIDTHIFYR